MKCTKTKKELPYPLEGVLFLIGGILSAMVVNAVFGGLRPGGFVPSLAGWFHPFGFFAASIMVCSMFFVGPVAIVMSIGGIAMLGRWTLFGTPQAK